MGDKFSCYLKLVKSTGTSETPEGDLWCGQQGVLSYYINVLSYVTIQEAFILKYY